MARSKSEKSQIVSGAGLITRVFSDLDKIMRSHGGTDEDWHRLTTPEGSKTLYEMARLMVPDIIEDSFFDELQVTIDYERSISDSVGACDFIHVDPEIFPGLSDRDEGEKLRTMVVIQTADELNTSATEELMRTHQLRPATLKELLVFSEKTPKLPNGTPLVALGSVGISARGRYVPIIIEIQGKRQIDMGEATEAYPWSIYTRFLAVRTHHDGDAARMLLEAGRKS